MASSRLTCWLSPTGELPPLDPTPVFSSRRTLQRLPDRLWKPVRDQALAQAGWRCEVCGYRPPPNPRGQEPLTAHEAWRYDLRAGVQWLDRLWSVCWWCHRLAHAEPLWAWPPPVPSQTEQDRYRELAAAARTAAAGRRWTLFRVELRDLRGREALAEEVIKAFNEADRRELPGMVRDKVRLVFDEPLRDGLTAEPVPLVTVPPLGMVWQPLVGLAERFALRDRILCSQPAVLAALVEPPTGWELARRRARAATRARGGPARRHFYGDWPINARAWRWPSCAGCGRLRPDGEEWTTLVQPNGSHGLYCPACADAAQAWWAERADEIARTGIKKAGGPPRPAPPDRP